MKFRHSALALLLLGCFGSSEVVGTRSEALCGSMTLTASPASPQVAGASVAFTASATCSTGTPEFRFWLASPPTHAWVAVRGWAASPTWTWASPSVAGSYQVEADTRTAGSSGSYESWTSIGYSLTSPPSPPDGGVPADIMPPSADMTRPPDLTAQPPADMTAPPATDAGGGGICACSSVATTLPRAYSTAMSGPQVTTLDATRSAVVYDIAGANIAYNPTGLREGTSLPTYGMAFSILDSAKVNPATGSGPLHIFGVNTRGQYVTEPYRLAGQRMRFLPDVDLWIYPDVSQHQYGADVMIVGGSTDVAGQAGGEVFLLGGNGSGVAGQVWIDAGSQVSGLNTPTLPHMVPGGNYLGADKALAVVVGNTNGAESTNLYAGTHGMSFSSTGPIDLACNASSGYHQDASGNVTLGSNHPSSGTVLQAGSFGITSISPLTATAPVTLGAGASLKWSSSLVQTTVGPAGAAAPIPGAPFKWLQVRDDQGNVLVVPAYPVQ